MRKLFAASIAALTLFAAGSSAHAQWLSGPTLPSYIKPEDVRGVFPNAQGGWDWIVERTSSDGVLHVIFTAHENPDGSIDFHRLDSYHTPEAEKQHVSMPVHRTQMIAKRPSIDAQPAIASSVSFSSSSHH